MAESYAPGASATAVAVRRGLHRNQIFAWRRQFRNRAALIGHAMPEFVPVTLASPTGSGPAAGGTAWPHECSVVARRPVDFRNGLVRAVGSR